MTTTTDSGGRKATVSMAMIVSRTMVKLPGQPPCTFELGDDFKSAVIDLGAGEPILGYATRHYRQTVAYTMKFKIGGESCSRPHRKSSDIWITNDVKLKDLTANMDTGARDEAMFKAQLTAADKLKKSLCGGNEIRNP